MIILSNCLTETIDEGCIKVANSFARRIKKMYPETVIISYDRIPEQTDMHLKLNKLFLNRKLLKYIHKSNQTIMYIPFSANTKASIVRTWILSRFARKKVIAVYVGCNPMNRIMRILLKNSGVRIVALSKESYLKYRDVIGEKAIYLKAGVDTRKFSPVSKERKEELREKYRIPQGKKVVLHVGHLSSGRNIAQLCKMDSKYVVYLVVSTTTFREEELTRILAERPNTIIVDTYLENIEEIYQMSDVYFFPVQERGHCIDIPLSAMEAAACNLPIVTTDYGELKELKSEEGFFFLDSFEKHKINQAVSRMISLKECNNREIAMKYDWDNAITELMSKISD